MSAGRLPASLGLSIALAIAVASTASAASFADCVRDVATKDLAAKTEFQRDLRDLVVRDRPEFDALATLNMELQIRLAEARRAMIDHLLARDPDRIDTTRGLGRFSNFAWSDEDSERFAAQDASYRELRGRIATLEERNNAHPDWPDLRAYYRAELGQSADFAALVTRLQSRQSEAESLLEGCEPVER